MTSRAYVASFAVFAIALTIAAPVAGGGRITLNDTGMTQCVDHQGDWSSDCAKSRQDATDGRDVHYANPDDGLAGFSFQKVCRSGQMAGEGTCPADPPLGSGTNNWACIYDNVSQLTWEVKTADGGLHDGKRSFTNKGKKARGDGSDAAWLVDRTNDESLCGRANWRLPDVLELQSIVDYGNGAPDRSGSWIDPSFFPNTLGWNAWTRTDSVSDSKSSWYVKFGDGSISFDKRFSQNGVRLVHNATRTFSRGKTAVSKARFIPSDDGTEVTDTTAGLVWRRCAAGMLWNHDEQVCSGTPAQFDWKGALDYAKANRKVGWRIPNVKELFSIVDLTKQSPAIDETAFPNTPTYPSFLSSTPNYTTANLYVHVVSFSSGKVFDQESFRAFSWPLRLVRRGRD
jgi:hypothetical protein